MLCRFIPARPGQGRKGSHVVYVPGNHDEFPRAYVGSQFGGIDLVDSAIHVTADGRRLLVIHGDQFDVVVRHARWLAHVGDHVYSTVLTLKTVFNRFRRRMGFSYWSLSSYLKLRVRNAVNDIGTFEEALAGEAKRVGADGVVCGHILDNVGRARAHFSLSEKAQQQLAPG